MRTAPPGFLDATRSFERWLGAQVPVVRRDLARKHEEMARSDFAFLRATFYRFLQRWPEVGGELARAPRVLAVGDLHVENFGTWRDGEGRLCWGVNDFDEASTAAYTLDLVRLAASAILAAEEGHLSLRPRASCDALLAGYTEGMTAGPAPFVLEDSGGWLRRAALAAMPDSRAFWERLASLRAPTRSPVRAEAERLLRRALPPGARPERLVARQAGLGSLGQPRLVLLATLHGTPLAREAKRLRLPAASWLAPARASISAGLLARRAARSADPCLAFDGRWVVRRLSPECGRVELRALAGAAADEKLLRAMGREVANVHHGTPAAVHRIRRDLDRRAERWLRDGALRALDAVREDARAWRGRAGRS